ncbi:exo-poly-alpha-D-galacturonosidase [Alteromonas confluentis]|uniref:Exo-poly-alpha-D-galacturonosidase n=2 Tax=Alteromonas confluentis TaxID=1656094 RepID=A0A1E7ZBY0_9ALTE|nr:exo-poly-alpha-D-galacturonosidase [Alteromonas confluentis]
MKKVTRLFFSLAVLGCGFQAMADSDVMPSVESIVREIKAPQIPANDFNVSDYINHDMAKAPIDIRDAVIKAINDAADAGGGRVIVPQGKWLVNGPLHLKSNIDLHISEGAHLLFSAKPEHYLPVVKTRWEGTEMFGYSPFIYAHNVHDIAITGTGIIDGNENSEFFSWHPQEKPDQLALRKMGINGVPVSQRQFGEGHLLRPSLIQIIGAERVLLEGYETHNSPFWVNHLVYTTHATVRDLKVNSHHANNDGVDVDSSSWVLIEGNVFRTGDDSIVVKSGRDRDGRDVGVPSEYIVVRNNDMGGEDGIALGSEMSGDIRYVWFTNNILRSGVSAVRFKANMDRGGVVEHIRVSDLQVEAFDSLFWFQLNYPGELDGKHPSRYRDIVFDNVTVEKAGMFLEVHGPDEIPVEDLVFRNVTVTKAEHQMTLENVKNLVFDNVSVNGQRINGALDWHK